MNTGQIRVELFDSPRQQGHTGESLKSVWCPHDHLESQVVVTGPVDLQVDKISVSLLGTLYPVTCMDEDDQHFLGFSRVWTLLSRPTEELRIDRTSYKVRCCAPRERCRYAKADCSFCIKPLLFQRRKRAQMRSRSARSTWLPSTSPSHRVLFPKRAAYLTSV